MNVRATPPVSPSPRRPKKVKDAVTTHDTFSNLALRLGMGQNSGFAGPGGYGNFGGNNPSNAMTNANYTMNPISRNRTLLEWAYRGSWICRQAVDAVADDMTRAGIDMQTDERPEDIEVLDAAIKRLGIWKSISDVSRWARLYGGAIGVIMIDGQSLETPLRPETVGKGQFRGIMVLDRWLVQPTLTDLVDEMGPSFGMPRYYDVVADFYPIPNQRIHYSRCIRLEGSEIPFWQRITENMWALSVLEPMWDRLVAFDSTTQGVAQLAYKAHLRVVRMKDLRLNVGAGGKKFEGIVKMMEAMRLFQSNEGITLLDAEDEFATNTYTFAGMSDVLNKFEAQLAGATKIPIVRLFGQSPGGLNATGESDIRNYYDTLHQEQENTLRGPLTTILTLLHYSELGHPPEPGFTFEFSPLWQLTELEKAQYNAAVTQSVNQTIELGYVSEQAALKELRQSSHISGIWSNITDEDISAAEDKPPLQQQREMTLGPQAESDYEIRKLEGMPHVDLPVTPQEQADLDKLQQQFGVGSRPATGGEAPEENSEIVPTPEQAAQIAALHQEYVTGNGNSEQHQVAVDGENEIVPTPEQQAELNALYREYATQDGIGVGRLAHAVVVNRMATHDAYNPNEPRVAKGEHGGGEWTSGGAHAMKTEWQQEAEKKHSPAQPKYQRISNEVAKYVENTLHSLGYTALVDSTKFLSARSVSELKVQPPRASPYVQDAVDGVRAMFTALESKDETKWIADLIKLDVPILFNDCESEHIAAVTITDPQAPHRAPVLMVNTKSIEEAIKVIKENDKLAQRNFSCVLARQAYDAALSAGKSEEIADKEAMKAYYESVICHEVGHLVDARSGGQFSDAMTGLVIRKFDKIEGAIIRTPGGGALNGIIAFPWFTKRLSGYAGSQPEEAFAEAFSSYIATGHCLHGEDDDGMGKQFDGMMQQGLGVFAEHEKQDRTTGAIAKVLKSTTTKDGAPPTIHRYPDPKLLGPDGLPIFNAEAWAAAAKRDAEASRPIEEDEA